MSVFVDRVPEDLVVESNITEFIWSSPIPPQHCHLKISRLPRFDSA